MRACSFFYSYILRIFCIFCPDSTSFLYLCVGYPLKETSAMKKILFHPFWLAALIAFSSCMDKDVYDSDCSDDGKSELDLSEGELY